MARLLLRECFFLLLFPFDLLVPKRKNYWLFSLKENVPWGDNLRSVFEYALASENIVPILLFCEGSVRPSLATLYKDTRAILVSKNSLAGLWYYFRSNVCFTCYTNFKFYSALSAPWCHFIVNLWHGVPIKAVGLLIPRWQRVSSVFFPPHLKVHAWIASSDVDRLAMALCMTKNRDLGQVWTTGLPRNDLLSSDKLAPDLQAEENKIKALKNGRKLLLYAPTWREWETTNPIFSKDYLVVLSKILDNSGYVLGIRKHIDDASIPKNHGCIDLNANVISNPQILLRNVDILVTDYSSIFVDYLLLNRPIIGFCYDYDKYLKDRTFLYDFKSIFPGTITQNCDELIESIQSLLKNGDTEEAAREHSTKIFFKYRDGNSTERVYRKVIEHVNGLKPSKS